MGKLSLKSKVMLAASAAVLLVMIIFGVYLKASQADAGGEAEDIPGESDQVVTLTASQQEHIGGYGADEETFIGLLESGVWANASETAYIEFTEKTATFWQGDDKTQTYSYAVQAVESEKVRENSQSKTVYTASAETSAGVYLMVLTLFDSTAARPTLKCELFGNEAFTGTELGRGVMTPDIEDDFLALLPDGGNQLVEAVRLVGSQKYPTADEATWSRECEIDYAEGTITTTFSYNSKSSSKEKFEVDMKSGAVIWD